MSKSFFAHGHTADLTDESATYKYTHFCRQTSNDTTWSTSSSSQTHSVQMNDQFLRLDNLKLKKFLHTELHKKLIYTLLKIYDGTKQSIATSVILRVSVSPWDGCVSTLHWASIKARAIADFVCTWFSQSGSEYLVTTFPRFVRVAWRARYTTGEFAFCNRRVG